MNFFSIIRTYSLIILCTCLFVFSAQASEQPNQSSYYHTIKTSVYNGLIAAKQGIANVGNWFSRTWEQLANRQPVEAKTKACPVNRLKKHDQLNAYDQEISSAPISATTNQNNQKKITQK